MRLIPPIIKLTGPPVGGFGGKNPFSMPLHKPGTLPALKLPSKPKLPPPIGGQQPAQLPTGGPVKRTPPGKLEPRKFEHLLEKLYGGKEGQKIVPGIVLSPSMKQG